MAKLGVVFSGGGGKGAYEIGVWKALKEYGIATNVKAVSGSSIGGLNSALFVKGDLESAIAMWNNISTEQVMKTNFSIEGFVNEINPANKTKIERMFQALLVAPPIGPATRATLMAVPKFTQKGVVELINKSQVCQAVSASDMPMYVCALNGNSMKLEIPKVNGLPEEEVNAWLQATSAIPFVFGSVSIKGERYHDGGVLPKYSNNTPYQPLIEKEGCTHIINVFLDRQPDTYQPQKNYPEVKFWNIVPTQAFDGLIAPLNFNNENAAKLIDLGYADTSAILKQFQSFVEDEERYLNAVCDFKQTHYEFFDQIKTNQKLRGTKETKGSLNTELMTLSFEDTIAELSAQLEQQERAIIDTNIDELINEVGNNTEALLESAFESITVLASTEGRINEQLEKGHIARIIGMFTGSNDKAQATINWDLNRSIYATQQLIQKVNSKHALTMEVVATLANKSNYLMSHVNLLQAKNVQLEQNVQRSFQLMKRGLESFAQSCLAKFTAINNRLDNLERAQLVDDWVHGVKARTALLSKVEPSELLIDLTTSFYNQLGRTWDANELCRYINVLAEYDLVHAPFVLQDIATSRMGEKYTKTVDVCYIPPLTHSNRFSHPVLKGLQIASETSEELLANKLNQELGFMLNQEVPGAQIGLELLYSLKRNDQRAPVLLTTNPDSQNEAEFHGKQAAFIQAVSVLGSINDTYLHNENTTKSLNFLENSIKEFKVVIPIVGKYSSGKSSLLNAYLGDDYLKSDITPETAFATELHFSEQESATIHYLNGDTKRLSIPELSQFKADTDIYFVQVFINCAKLRNRPQIVLVDMPGFDSNTQSHHKAIACYLQRGDAFINLMPSNVPFDASVVEQLQEIHFDYRKPIFNFISKAARRTTTELTQLTEELEQSLSESLLEPVQVSLVESSADKKNLSDFERVVDNIAQQYDEFLQSRYGGLLLKEQKKIVDSISALQNGMISDEAKIKEDIAKADQLFRQLEKDIQLKLEDSKYRLCSLGSEQLISQASAKLNNEVSSLVSAAKSNSLSVKINDLLRPILQKGLETLIAKEQKELEEQFDKLSQNASLDIQINIQVPAYEKEAFSAKYAVIGAGLSALFLGPLGAALVAGLSGLFGCKDNAEERDRQIENVVRNEAIPQALTAVSTFINDELIKLFKRIETVVLAMLEDEKQAYKQQLNTLEKQCLQSKQDFVKQQNDLAGAKAQLANNLMLLQDDFPKNSLEQADTSVSKKELAYES